MVKYLKRKTDNKYLKSVDTDTWVDNIKEAFDMTYRECEAAKTALSKDYSEGELVEIVDFIKIKPMTQEEREEIKNLLKK